MISVLVIGVAGHLEAEERLVDWVGLNFIRATLFKSPNTGYIWPVLLSFHGEAVRVNWMVPGLALRLQCAPQAPGQLSREDDAQAPPQAARLGPAQPPVFCRWF